MGSLPGGGVCPVEGGSGCLPSLPWWGGGRGRGGLVHLKTLVTCLGSQGTLCPCSLLMIRVGRPWNLLLLLVGPGPFSLMHPASSNKSSSEGDTTLINVNWIRNIKSQSKKMGANKSQCVILHICLVSWAALCLRLSGKNRQISYLSSRNAALIFCCCKKKIT
jgi:hypothetical protein